MSLGDGGKRDRNRGGDKDLETKKNGIIYI